MSELRINPGLQAALQDACVALGGHPLQRILARVRDEIVEIDDRDLAVIRDYIARIEEHVAAKHPGHSQDESGYDPAQEDLYLDDMAAYRDKLVYMVASVVGDDFLDRSG